MAVATWATVTLAVPDCPSTLAVMVAVPSATAVTSPSDDTVATDGSDELHDRLAPDTVPPVELFTVAESCPVSPTLSKDRLAGANVTL
jgi:hypothetical protein